MGGVIDLRSDTVTKPSAEMLQAMIGAEVGDDVLDGDPTTRRLERRVADLLGMEAALFFPSGTQANQTAVWVLSQPGTEIVLEAQAHVVDYELGALASLSGVQPRPVRTRDGILTREAVQDAWRHPSPYLPRASMLAGENTHNASGGKVMSVAIWDGLVAEARARIWTVHGCGTPLWPSTCRRRGSRAALTP
jgi:threonine aldolase